MSGADVGTRVRTVLRGKALFWAAIGVLVLAVALLFSRAPQAKQSLSPAESVTVLVEGPATCNVPVSEARDRGLELERTANAHWERVPFDVGEAPTALYAMTEAARCFALAGDREGRRRADVAVQQLDRELRRRFERARLELEMATRAKDPRAVRRHATTLLSLSARAGEGMVGYRGFLERVEREARSELAEARARAKEKDR